MSLRIAKLLALIAAIQISGGHWAALQSVAWVSMVIDYSKRDSSLGSAIGKVFDGAHPCSLCKTVSKGRDDEQKRGSLKLSVKIEAIVCGQLVVPGPPDAVMVDDGLMLRPPEVTREPLLPPPLV